MRLRFLVLAAAALSSAFAQSVAPSGKPAVTIRATTTLVQVNVVAHDAKGQAVGNLKKEDFEISDKGKPQSIAVFIGERTVTPTPPPAPPAMPPGVFTNQLLEKPSKGGGYAVILLDYYNSGFRNAARARQKAIEMVNRLGPSATLALYTLDRSGLHVASELGSDRPTLLKKLDKAMGMPAVYYQSSLDGLGDTMDNYTAGGASPLDRDALAFYTAQRITDTLDYMEALAAHLAGLPGRKAVIWVSSAFPLQVQQRAAGNAIFSGTDGGYQTYNPEVTRAMKALNNADVALYPVDPRALSTESPMASHDGDGPPAVDDFTWGTMDFFASRTGGVAFYGRNDMDVGMQAAAEDVQVSYTLGFYASKDGDPGGFHQLNVRSLRPGVTLRYKEGYYTDANGKPKPADLRAAAAKALTGITDATAIPLDAAATRVGKNVQLRVALHPETLALEKKGDRWKGAVDFVTRFAKEDGTQAGSGSSRRIEFNLTQQTYDKSLRSGLLFSRTIEAPRNAVSVRVLVRNNPSGEMGTLTIPLKDVAGY